MARRCVLARAWRIRCITDESGAQCAGQWRKLRNVVGWVNDKILMRIGQASEAIRR